MKRSSIIGTAWMFLVFLGVSPGAFATNGDNLIGIGPIARSMGGVGIAAPQDAISAVFANPASMCSGPFCPSSTFDFARHDIHAAREGCGEGRCRAPSRATARQRVWHPGHRPRLPLTVGCPSGVSASRLTGCRASGWTTGEPPWTGHLGGVTPAHPGRVHPAPGHEVRASHRGSTHRHDLSLGIALHIDYASLDLRGGVIPGLRLWGPAGRPLRAFRSQCSSA